MGTTHMTAAHMDGGDNDLVGSKPVHQQADCCDVCNCVHSAHLMEVNLRHRNAVGLTLRLRNCGVDSHNVVLDLFRDRKMAPYNMFNVMQAAMVEVSMTMLMHVLVTMLLTMFVLVIMVIVAMVMPMAVKMAVMALFLFTMDRD